MTMKLHPASIALASLLISPALSSDVIISNFSSGVGTGTAFGSGANTIYKAFGFTMGATSYTLEEVALSLNVTGAAIDPQLQIWSDAGSTPGAPLFTLDDPAALVGQMDFVFTAGAPFTLDAGTTYWLYLESVPVGGDSFLWDGTNPSMLPTGGSATAVGYEFNGNGSSFFNRLEIRGSTDSPGANYCSANLNSTGVAGEISAMGSAIATANDLTLIASSVPPLAFGFFLASQTQGLVPNPGGSSGNLCVTGAVGRYVGSGQIQQSTSAGTFELSIDLNMTPQPTGFVSIAAGETWNFQGWHRDTGPAGPTSNFTNGLSLDFQ